MDGYVREPQQARSRRTLERIVQAALDILEQDGPGGLTVQAVVSRARSSVGSFYARFAGKEDLLRYLGERMWEEAAARWEEALASRRWDELELDALIEGSVSVLAEVTRTGGRHLRALAGTGAGEAAFRRFRGQVLDGMARLLLDRAAEIVHPDPSLAVRVGLQAVVGILDAADLPEGAGAGDAVLAEEAARLLRAYLKPSPATAEGPPEQVDFFDIWG